MKPIPAAMVLCLILLPMAILADDQVGPLVHLDSGPIRGLVDKGVRAYLGIPYAAPPVGALRWRPPQAAVAWTEVRDGTAFGPACPQPGQTPDGAYDEDCLSLNVWTPATTPGERLPVMVWIHGGGFNFGASSQPEYQGTNLARHGVVVVTVNYRLGPLGFFVHPRLAEASPHHVSGNYGLLDQIAALHWVQRNIMAFGGDPGNVTVFGQSAGSRSVSLLLMSPQSAGLFHRAIAQSGGPILGSQYLDPDFNGDAAEVSAMGEQLAVRLGCGQASDVLTALRAKSAQEVITAAACSTGLFTRGLFFAPVYDGWILPESAGVAFTLGHQHDVPLIVGSTANEGRHYLAREPDLSLPAYHAFVQVRFGDQTAQALTIFPAATDMDVAGAIDRVVTVGANAQPARFMARAMAGKKSRAYLYQFNRRPQTALARRFGAHHGVDLAYVFGHTDRADGYDATDQALSQAMMAYWVNFARTGDPNGPGLAAWPAYDGATDRNLEFSDAIRVNAHLFGRECDFIDRQAGLGQAKP